MRLFHLRFSLVALGITLAALACAAEPPDGPLAPGDHDLTVAVGDETRRYILHLPRRANVAAPVPLLLAFHGGGGNAKGFRDYAGLDAVADREGFAVAYPDGSGGIAGRLLTWNAGECCGRAMRDGVDDVAFIRALVRDAEGRVQIDRDRIYATGHSNGGMMSYRLAVEAPDLVAAIAPVGGAMILTEPQLTRPVPVLHIHSVDDPRALYAGGLGPPFPMTNHRVNHHAVETELSRWTRRNGCRETAQVLDERADPKTGHTATLLSFEPCSSGAPVLLFRLTGAGHGWPGTERPLRERIIGPHTTVVSAAEETWGFLSKQRLRADQSVSASSIAWP